MNAKNVLTHLVRAGRDALHMEETLKQLGYKETPYFNLYGEISSAIYSLLNEDTETFDESMTYAAMHDIYTSDDVCAERLAEMYDADSGHVTILSEETAMVINDVARNRGIEPNRMINLILCEWAARQLMIDNCLKQ